MVLDAALKADNMRVQMVTGERFAIIDAVSALAAQGERMSEGGGVQVSGASFGSPAGAHDSYVPQCTGARALSCRGADGRVGAAVRETTERLQVFEELLARQAISKAEHDHHRALLLAGL